MKKDQIVLTSVTSQPSLSVGNKRLCGTTVVLKLACLIQTLVLLLASCLTLDKLFNFFVTHFLFGSFLGFLFRLAQK